MLTARFYTSIAAALSGGRALSDRLFIAVGTGDPRWDREMPLLSRDTDALVNEIARKPVGREDRVFVDAERQPTTDETPRLRLSVAFGRGEGVGVLRECGLFGGDASASAESGILLAYYIHPRIDKDEGAILTRTIHIDLTPQNIAPGARIGRYMGNSGSREVHDLENLTRNCQVDEVPIDRRFYVSSLEHALTLGYDRCAYCLPEQES